MAAITATEQDVWPPRILLTVTGLTLGDDVAVYRSIGGQRTPVRGGQKQGVTDTSFLLVDAEQPFGAAITYVATVNGSAEYTVGPTTYVLPGGKVVLSDAISGLAAEVVIAAWAEKSYSRRSTRFAVGGETIVVTGPMGRYEGQMDIFTETTSSRDQVETLLRNATQAVIQIRQPGTAAYDGVDSYVVVDAATERRHSQDGSDPRRMWTLDAAEVSGWAAILEARGYTYADVEAYYEGLTYADAEADHATYLAAEQAEYPA